MGKITLPIAILLSAVVLAGGLFAVQYSKQRSIERQQQIELQAKAEVNQTKTEQAQEKEQAQVQSSTILNSCIASAQKARDYRKGNLDQNLLDYLKAHSYTPDETYDYMKRLAVDSKVKIDKKYDEWADECKRGVKPDLTEFVY